ncbi:MAG: SPOR domain-containing protein [bacterium]
MKIRTMCWPLLFGLILNGCSNKESGDTSQKSAAVVQADSLQVAAQPNSVVPETAPAEPLEQEPVQVVQTAEGNYTVQVSSWHTRAAAERDAQRFDRYGYDAYVQKAYLADRDETWYRVRIGHFPSLQAGRELADELSEHLEAGYWLDKVRAEK